VNRIIAVTLATLLAVGLPVQDAEAKRLSNGGMKRSVPTQPAPQTPPAQPAAPRRLAPPPRRRPSAPGWARLPVWPQAWVWRLSPAIWALAPNWPTS
jgi:hypothetical protein